MSKRRKTQRSNKTRTKKLLKFFALGAVLAALAIFAFEQTRPDREEPVTAYVPQLEVESRSGEADVVPAGWTVGELRPNGLRIVPTGRSDASRVLDPEQFSDPEVRRAYEIATQIPGVLNQLYCWCGCENRGVHRSNLGCFEDMMSVNCAVCRGTAEIAYEMVRQGVTDAGRIQAAVDAKWAPADRPVGS